MLCDLPLRAPTRPCLHTYHSLNYIFSFYGNYVNHNLVQTNSFVKCIKIQNSKKKIKLQQIVQYKPIIKHGPS